MDLEDFTEKFTTFEHRLQEMGLEVFGSELAQDEEPHSFYCEIVVMKNFNMLFELCTAGALDESLWFVRVYGIFRINRSGLKTSLVWSKDVDHGVGLSRVWPQVRMRSTPMSRIRLADFFDELKKMCLERRPT